MHTLKNDFLNGKYNEFLSDLYSGDVETQVARYVNAIETFEKLYGNGDIEIYSAPGRTEIGGNHTDHQNGKVLAASVNLDAVAVVSERNDNIIRITSEGYGEIEVDISDDRISEKEFGTTASLVRGVAACFRKRGYNVGGFDGYVTSNVLSGSGLSSSAAYEVLIGNILSGLYNDYKIDSITIAKIGKEAENIYFGKPCGLLDQTASSVGGLITVDFADVDNPLVEKIDVDFKKFNHALCIVDTKGSHADLTDEYASIPSEMKSVAGYFGKEYLSQVDKKDFYKNISHIRNISGDRAILRAIHWYAENERVDGQVNALKNNDFDEFKNLINASGNSSFKYLQNVHVSNNTKEQNLSLALALGEEILKDKGVCRVHGGGFAGTIQAFVPLDMVNEFKSRMEDVFGKDSCYVLSVRNHGGVRIV